MSDIAKGTELDNLGPMDQLTKQDSKEKKGNRPRSQSSIIPKNMAESIVEDAMHYKSQIIVDKGADKPKKSQALIVSIPRRVSANEHVLAPMSPFNTRAASESSGMVLGRSTSLQQFKVMPLADLHTFAYFRKNDTRPKRQRQLLYAFHLRHLEISAIYEADEKFVPRGEVVKGPSVLLKLNSLLKSKPKKKKTRSGIFLIIKAFSTGC